MNARQTLSALAVLALAWQGGPATAQEPAQEPAPTTAAAPLVSWCDSCCSACCDCAGGCGLRGGYSLYILKPHWDNDPAYRVRVNIDHDETDVDFNWDYNPASVIWLGAVNDSGFGGRVRWFYFDQSPASTSLEFGRQNINQRFRTAAPLGLNIDINPNPFNNGSAFDTQSNLTMNVLDFEAMQEINSGQWSLLVTGGIRYAHVSQNYKAFFAGNGNPQQEQNSETDELISGHNFNGAGPTVSLSARRALGNSNLALFASARGALLFGRGAQQGDLVTTIDGNTTNHDSAHAEWDQIIPVAELELGIDWTMNLRGSVVFLEFAVVGHNWFGIGNAANNEIIGNAGGNTDEISDNKSNLGMFGFKFAGGIGW